MPPPPIPATASAQPAAATLVPERVAKRSAHAAPREPSAAKRDRGRAVRGGRRRGSVDVRRRRALAARSARTGAAGTARRQNQVPRSVHCRTAVATANVGHAIRRSPRLRLNSRAARRGGDTAKLCRSPEVAEWRALFAPHLRDENIVAVNAVDRDGRIIASTLPELVRPAGAAAQDGAAARAGVRRPHAIHPALRRRLAARGRAAVPRRATARVGRDPGPRRRRATSWPRSASRPMSTAISRASCPRRVPATPARPMPSTRPARCSRRSATCVDCTRRHAAGGRHRAAFRLKLRDPGRTRQRRTAPPAPPPIGR